MVTTANYTNEWELTNLKRFQFSDHGIYALQEIYFYKNNYKKNRIFWIEFSNANNNGALAIATNELSILKFISFYGGSSSNIRVLNDYAPNNW